MLEEVKNASQNEEHLARRIFVDEYFVLFVWYYKPEMTIKGFQLCYDIGNNEHAVTWQDHAGFTHNRIDSGRWKNQTPLLVADGIIPIDMITARFKMANTALDAELNEFILSKLGELQQEAGSEYQNYQR